MIKIMCKMNGVDVDFSEKKLECLWDIMDDDVDMVLDETASIGQHIKTLESAYNKFSSLISGEEVNLDGWICKLVEVTP
jgi:hypothetical protein